MLHSKQLTVTCLAFAPDSQILVSGDEHGTVTLWDLSKQREPKDFSAHQGWVKGLAVSSDGRTLVTAGNDGMIRVWNTASMCRERHSGS
jgi:WD40 repeat protein